MYTYAPYIPELRQRGFLVKVDAFIVGALGSWDPLNDRVLSALNLPKYAFRGVRRFCGHKSLSWSYKIYLHITELQSESESSSAPTAALLAPSVGRRRLLCRPPLSVDGLASSSELLQAAPVLLSVNPTQNAFAAESAHSSSVALPSHALLGLL